jgi:hypothetical protein
MIGFEGVHLATVPNTGNVPIVWLPTCRTHEDPFQDAVADAHALTCVRICANPETHAVALVE